MLTDHRLLAITKRESILDAKGGPQDFVIAHRLDFTAQVTEIASRLRAYRDTERRKKTDLFVHPWGRETSRHTLFDKRD